MDGSGAIGGRVGAYEVGRLLGTGGFGEVYEGRHPASGRRVALKRVVGPSSAAATERVLAEARAFVAVDHPHLVRLLDVVEAAGTTFLVLELVEGGTLRRLFRTEGLTVPASCAVVMGLADGIHHAHRRSVLHRDVKPDNVLVTLSRLPKIGDFGIATALGGPPARPAAGGGTVGYMPPEQARGEPLSPAADVFALAAVLYELLTGERPPADAGGPVPPLWRAGHVPPEVASVCDRALRPDVAERTATAEELAVGLAEATTSAWGPGWLDGVGFDIRLSPAVAREVRRYRPRGTPAGPGRRRAEATGGAATAAGTEWTTVPAAARPGTGGEAAADLGAADLPVLRLRLATRSAMPRAAGAAARAIPELVQTIEAQGGVVLAAAASGLLAAFPGPGGEGRAAKAAAHVVGEGEVAVAGAIGTGRWWPVHGPGAAGWTVLEGPGAGRLDRRADAAPIGTVLGPAGDGDGPAAGAALGPGGRDGDAAPRRARTTRGSSAPARRLVVAAVRLPLSRRRRAETERRVRAVAEALDAAAGAAGVAWTWAGPDPDGTWFHLVAGERAPSELDDERAVAAAWGLVDACRATGATAAVAAGTGAVVAAGRAAWVPVGPPVDEARRLAAAAPRGAVLVAGTVARSAVDGAGGRAVAGADAVRLTGRAAAAARRAPGRLVGRRAEVDALRSAWTAAASGAGRVVDVVGEAGAGKSALVRHARPAPAPGRLLAVAGRAPLRAAPYAALRGGLAGLVGGAASTPAAAGLALAGVAGRVAPEVLPWLPLVAQVAGAEVPTTPEVGRLDPELVRLRLHAALAGLLLGIASDAGGLWVEVEDLHWLDDASAAFLRHLAEMVDGSSVALVTTRRPDGAPLTAGEILATRVDVGPLPAGDASELLLRDLGATALADDRIADLLRLAGGNALFLRELAAAAADGRPDAALPRTVEELVGRRVAALDGPDRDLLRAAAVVGAESDVAVLAAAAEDGSVRDPARWVALGGFVVHEGDRVVFRHDVAQQVVYAGTPARRRRSLHGRAADVLLDRVAAPSAGAGDLAAAAWHLDRSGRAAEACRWAVAAARSAAAGGALVEAAVLFERAVAADRRAGSVPGFDRAGAWEALGDARERLGRLDGAARAYRAAIALRRAAGDTAAVVRLLVKRGTVAEKAGRYAGSLRWFREARRVVEAGGLPPRRAASALAAVHLGEGLTQYYRGRLPSAAERCRLGLAEARSARDLAAQARAHLQLEMVLSELGHPARADHATAARGLLERLDDRRGLGNLELNLGVSAYNEGRWPATFGHYRRSEALFDEIGDTVGLALVANNRAEILTDQGAFDEAADHLARARRLFRASGYRNGVAMTTSGSSRLALRAGRYAEAHELLSTAMAEFANLGAEGFVVDTQVRVVELLVAQGQARAGLSAAADATAALARHGPVALLPVALCRLEAMAHVSLGEPRRAAAAARKAVDAGAGENARFEEAVARLVLAVALGRATGGGELAAAREALAAMGVRVAPRPVGGGRWRWDATALTAPWPRRSR